MYKIKSLVTLALILFLGLGLISCSHKESTDESVESKTESKIESSSKPKVVNLSGALEKDMESFPEISFKELNKKIKRKLVTVIDVNSLNKYKKGHIPTAINFYEHKANLLAVLPSNMNAEIVSYCSSPSCTAWFEGATAIRKLGYTNIKHYAGGLKGWQESGAELVK